MFLSKNLFGKFLACRKNIGIKFLAEFLAEIFSSRSENTQIDLLGKFAGKKFSEIFEKIKKQKIVAST